MKKLYRSNTNRIIAGVIGGLGEYMDIDPTVLRIVWVLIVLVTGVVPGIIAYIIALFIVPSQSEAAFKVYEHDSENNSAESTTDEK